MRFQLREFTESPEAKAKDAIVRNVICLGQKSKNGRTYSRQAMKNAAALMEGCPVYVNHASGPRRIEDRFGSLRDVHFIDANPPEVRGDLHFLRSHRLAEVISEDLARPGLSCFGLSLYGDGSGVKRADGSTLIETVTRILSVDIVTGPATCRNFREQTATPSFALALAEQAHPRASRARKVRKVREPFPTNFSPREKARWLNKYCND